MDDKTTKIAFDLLRARLSHALLIERHKTRLLKIEGTRPLTKEEKAEYDWLREDGKQVGFKELTELCKLGNVDSPKGFEDWDDD